MLQSNAKHFIWLCIVTLIGCASTHGKSQYRVESIGNAQRSVSAVVLSTKSVIISERTTGLGANAGGALGGALAIDNSDSAGVLIAGIIAGAIVGEMIESSGKTYNGTEYLIESETGLLLNVAQVNHTDGIHKVGDKVVLVYGYPHRLIKDPR